MGAMKSDRAARLARLPKGTCWEAEHFEIVDRRNEGGSVSKEVAGLILEKRNVFVRIRNPQTAWTRKYREL